MDMTTPKGGGFLHPSKRQKPYLHRNSRKTLPSLVKPEPVVASNLMVSTAFRSPPQKFAASWYASAFALSMEPGKICETVFSIMYVPSALGSTPVVLHAASMKATTNVRKDFMGSPNEDYVSLRTVCNQTRRKTSMSSEIGTSFLALKRRIGWASKTSLGMKIAGQSWKNRVGRGREEGL